MASPDFGLALGYGSDLGWSDGWEPNSYGWWVNGADNVVVGTNPPFAIGDFAAIFPKFLGSSTPLTATTVSGSSSITIPAAAGAAIGQIITSSVLPPNSTVVSVNNNGLTLVLSNPVQGTGTASFALYNSPLMPLAVINAYIALASACIAQARWFDSWNLGMCLYVAHYCTLWLLTEGTPGQPANQMAISAAQRGIGVLTSKSADGVSAAYQPFGLTGAWASWGLTSYGVQLASIAKIIGMGGMYIQG